MPNFSFLSGSNILVRGGWLYSDYIASLSSNWTELDWTGTELGNSGHTLYLTKTQSATDTHAWQLAPGLQVVLMVDLVGVDEVGEE